VTPDEVKKAVAEALDEDRKSRKDPYRTPLQFFLGVSTLGLALIIAILTALVSENALAATSPVAPMLGGALAGVTLSLFLALFCIAVLQAAKVAGWKLRPWVANTLMVIVNLSGIIPLSFALRGGAALLNRSAALPPLADVPGQLWNFLW
jgi:hypothetical protein